MATKKTTESQEFMYLPLGNIIVEEQIRSAINTESESFKALTSSIKERGVLEPVLVTSKDDKYLLLCGERRYLAASKAGQETIPARVVNAITQKDEILAFQLTENLQREDLNPIDQAKGILAFIQAKHPDKGYDVGGVMSEFVNCKLKPDDPSNQLTPTVGVIIEITGKSITTLFNVISLLKLVPKIQDAISNGTLPVSQGYLFAANLASPDFFVIFDEIMKTPVTNTKLEKMLTSYKKAKPDNEPAPVPMQKQVAHLQSIKTYIEMEAGTYTKPDLQVLIEELRAFLTLAEKQFETAPEAVPEKKTGKVPMV
jgi:ParB family transcriptional regulator, chromosome partitioning protein